MWNPRTTPFWEFSNCGESKSKKRLITKNSGLPMLLRWSHALLSDQNFCLGGIIIGKKKRTKHNKLLHFKQFKAT
jgi:hypothetical protein